MSALSCRPENKAKGKDLWPKFMISLNNVRKGTART